MSQALAVLESGVFPADWDDLSFRLVSVQVLKTGDEVQTPQQLIFSFALLVVSGGAVQLLVDHTQLELNTGSVYLCRPGQTFGSVHDSGSLEMYIFYFDIYKHEGEKSGGITKLQDVQLFPQEGILQLRSSQPFAAISAGLSRLEDTYDRKISFRMQIEFQELLYEIRMNGGKPPRDTNSALIQAKQYIEDHYMQALTLEELAKAAEFSPKYFVDLFKKKYGKSAMEYVSELRLQQAKRLMAQNGIKLREVAHRVGYADEFYFSRKFKKMIGVPPAVYMKSRRRKLVAYTPAMLGQLLPLNITPYAAALHPKWTEYYYRNYRGDIPVHISAYRSNQDWEANMDLLRQFPADLILAADGLHEDEKLELERIAPVYYSAASDYPNWRSRFLQLSHDLGEDWQAEQWLAAYDWEVRSVRDQLYKQLGHESVVVIRMLGSKLYLYCTKGMGGMLFTELGLRQAYESGMDTYNIPVTPSELADLRADHLLLLIRRENDTLAEWNRLQNDPQWLQISAVQRHQVHFLSSDPWREDSAYAQLRMLRQLMQLFPVIRPS